MDKTRILIVEDEGIVALDLENRMRDLGYAVAAVVPSGEEAIEEAARTQPDLVVMDIRLRGSINGIEAARAICGRFDTPVVYLTALGDEETVQRAFEVPGAYGYAGKPFDDTELHATIEMALRQHRAKTDSRKDET
jgi:DNA-binding response OmpR family regulator